MKKEGKLHTRNAGVTKENNLISNWLKEHSDPTIDKLAKCNLAIANRIADILSQKNMKPADLAKTMGKQRSTYQIRTPKLALTFLVHKYR